jgi:protein-S-isoprenylcysteine O-methyltransferase Ste14
VLWTSWLVLMALDAGRFGWSRMPVWAQAIGAILIALCMTIACLAFRENSYAAPVVKIARERGHRVVSTGPYACVRHPMYAGALLFFVGTPLLLGSWYGLAAALVLVALLVTRTVMEERTLTDELPGYPEYAARVRWRLAPGIW